LDCHTFFHTVLGVDSLSRQDLGRLGEHLAAAHFARLGFDVVDQNYRTRWGEIDLIAFDGGTIVFCEVKTRRTTATGRPLEAVHRAKRAQLRRMAVRWLIERDDRPFASELRFDAVGITLDRQGNLLALEHVENAW